MRVIVVAEWYPSRADRVHGIWAHRQALATRAAGADVRVLALRRPVPPLAVVRAGPAAIGRWARSAPATLKRMELDGLAIEPVPFIAPPRPWSYGSWGAWMAPALRLALRRERFDVIHAHNVLPTGEAALRALRRQGGAPALVVSTHGPDIMRVVLRSARAARQTRDTLRSAAVVIANSSWSAERCEQLAEAPLACAVVHFGAETPSSPPRLHDRPTIVTVAHLQARKRHAIVMRALASMPPQSRPDYVIVGDGEMRAPLQRLRDELGLSANVRFLGQLDHPDALMEMWRCHVFAMPSVEEPFGVAYVEAMAGGVPTIGCESEGGPRDIAAAGGGMTLVPADDHFALAAAIESSLRDRAQLGVAARATAKRSFTWERCGKLTLDAYEAAFARAHAA